MLSSTAYIQDQARQYDEARASTLSALSDQGGTPYVYTGSGRTATGNIKSMDALMSEFESMSVKQKKNLARLLVMAGMLPKNASETLEEAAQNATLIEVADAYAELLASSAARFANGQLMSPDDLLEMHIRYNYGDAVGPDFSVSGGGVDGLINSLSGGGEVGKPHTEKMVQESVDIWNADDARTLARATLQSVLGRDPTEAEYEDFVAALQTAQRNNPVVSTTKTRYDAEGNVVKTRTTNTGGIDPSTVAENWADRRPDMAEWQAVGTYFPAAMAALGSVVPGA